MSVCKLKWFSQTWWSFVFPNTGFIIAIIDIGTAIDSPAILWVASVATVVQVAMWLLVFGAHVRAVVKKHILWPGKGKRHIGTPFSPTSYQLLRRKTLFQSNNQPLFLLPCFIDPGLLPSITNADSISCVDEDHDA